jgi:hypothetical protein
MVCASRQKSVSMNGATPVDLTDEHEHADEQQRHRERDHPESSGSMPEDLSARK